MREKNPLCLLRLHIMKNRAENFRMVDIEIDA